jgi:lipid A 3-O-deacylase
MRLSIAAAVAFFVVLVHAKGGTETTADKKIVVTESPFDRGKLELQSSSGAYFSVGSGNRGTLNYSATAYRLGVMLQSPSGDGCFRGNCELLLQLFGGSVFDGPGNALGGAAIMLRYNFVQPEARWVPYIQIAAGTVYSDIYKDHEQRLIGQAWEIDLEAALGIRYLFNDRWSANLEGGYRHISNADYNDRNVGLNSLGVTAGLGRHW